ATVLASSFISIHHHHLLPFCTYFHTSRQAILRHCHLHLILPQTNSGQAEHPNHRISLYSVCTRYPEDHLPNHPLFQPNQVCRLTSRTIYRHSTSTDCR